VEINASEEIALTVGGSTIVMKPGGIWIDGQPVNINCGNSAPAPAPALSPAAGGAGSPTPSNSGSASSASGSQVSGSGQASTGVKTGLGDKVDALAAKSPTMQQELQKVRDDGWTIQYGPAKAGSTATAKIVNGVQKGGTIIIDGQYANNPNLAAGALAHELGHATNPINSSILTQANCVNSYLTNEGTATLSNIQASKEIANNGGPTIPVFGENSYTYRSIYDQAVQAEGNPGVGQAQQIGAIYGTSEKTSNTGETYNQYYQDRVCNPMFPPAKK
jgi:type VI secretion system secreted protein VgrG